MSIPQILLYITIASYFYSLPKFFEKAGEASWKGYVPILNLHTWLNIMGKPWWWIFLFIFPGVNFLMLIVVNVELLNCIRKKTSKDYALAIIAPFAYLPYLASQKEIKFYGAINYKEVKRSKFIEWGDALVFATVAATIIRSMIFEPFVIPTPSMERNLLVGDFLFVSKFSYGSRLPMTPMSFPFAHNTMPGVKTKSYLEWFPQGYSRLPGLSDIERNDVVVFNFPAGDTSILHDELQGHTYAQILRDQAFGLAHFNLEEFEKNHSGYMDQARKNMRDGHFVSNPVSYDPATKKYGFEKRKTRGISSRPVDKRENYIKRCVAIAGDTIQVIDSRLFVNGKLAIDNKHTQYNYVVNCDPISKKLLYKRFKIDPDQIYPKDQPITNYFMAPLDQENLPLVIATFGEENVTLTIDKIEDINFDKSRSYCGIYPNNSKFKWTKDFFGPLYIPKKGRTIDLTEENFILYRRCIEAYELNEVKVVDGTIFINGEKATSYTFQMNYYWLMGDNRHNSADSRMWGFVPEDHVVGKAQMIWFSKGDYDGIRWDRIFQSIN